MGIQGVHAVVTGGSGFVGQRLVEMLVERGARKVVSFDIAPKPKDALADERVEYQQGDICDQAAVDQACKGADCVWHMAALVGPYYQKEKYWAVNYKGTVNVIDSCRRHSVRKIIMSGSPSTFFDGSDIRGAKEEDLRTPKKFLQAYAETKHHGQVAMREACCNELLTTIIAPHQVYGPRDTLFFPNLLEAGGTGRLRVFGKGDNKISVCHVDNYCHGLILGYDALYKDSPALAKFYIITDDGYQLLWRMLDVACVSLGFRSLFSKFRLPVWLLMPVAYVCLFLSWLLRVKIKLNPFAVKMLTIDRWFNIENAKRHLKYTPIKTFEEGWSETIEWFRAEWLPKQKF